MKEVRGDPLIRRQAQNAMPPYIPVAKVGEIREGRGRTFRVGERMVAVFLVGGQYYALDDYCPHMGASLGCGEVCDQMVICDQHRWAFSLLDGSSPDVPTLRATTFPVRVDGDEIQVDVAGNEEG